MGKVTGFIEFQRKAALTRPIEERVKDYREVYIKLPSDELRTQGARCMDCGIPFCHTGCPLNNIIPDWNDLVYKDRWKEALQSLHSTNNFPEFTGRVCPAPCEAACVLGINDDPVTIKQIEKNIADRGFFEGWIKPQPPQVRTGKKVAVIGSGPAGMAAAQQLNRAGHTVTLFERADRIGGLLRYGIPDFKMEKHLIDRRVEQMEQEGVLFRTGVNVGVDVVGQALLKDFDAVLITIGSTIPRDLPIPGRELSGVHFAMEFLPQQNRRVAGLPVDPQTCITAKGKKIVIIGGGDTGTDCLGTSIRQGATEIHMIELLPMPPEARTPSMPWPNWPMILRTESSHEEGGKRQWSISTKEFIGKNGVLKKLHVVRMEWSADADRRPVMKEIPGSDFEIEADLVLLAMGFLHPQKTGLVEQLGVALDPRGNVAVNENFATSVPNVFAAGDAQRGQSLVVWALAGGRKAARAIDLHLMGKTNLPV
ncbi:MAG: glutamate synthase [Acidobacteria bacterium RIFCSPLOWO2_12_FULL_54_10]|nr:MAG: glutamate synthase [Acidobacteria bacterium RIFCSPLOWO2_12_FULL_54_10]